MASPEQSASSSVTAADHDPDTHRSEPGSPQRDPQTPTPDEKAKADDEDDLQHLPPAHLQDRDSSDVEKGADKQDENKPNPDLITWDGPTDPQNPKNFPLRTKVGITAIWVIANLVPCVASSIYSSGAQQIQQEFNISTPVTTLGISLFLCGYTAGPPIYGPLSEKFGRKWPTFVGVFGFTCFCLPEALGTNIQTILVGRFFAGCFGVAPLTITGGAMVDIWKPTHRGIALGVAIGSIFASPVLAPVMGNFIAASYLGWRWTAWLSGIMGLSTAVLIALFLPETYEPLLLQRKAKKARKAGNAAAHSEYDETGGGFGRIARVYLLRPFALLATEPILLLVTLYQAFVYGILYLIFEAFPIAFREQRGWALGVSSLPYLGVLVGVLLGMAIVIWHTQTKFAASIKRNGGEVVPEQRLPVMILGGVLLPVGCFIFGWTSYPDLTYAGMIVGSIPMGAGLFLISVQCITYIVDVYLGVANSAMGGNTMVRSCFGAGFPLFAPYMFHNLGVQWAMSVLGFIAIAMFPIPVIFCRYGHVIRSWSKNSVSGTGSAPLSGTLSHVTSIGG